MALGRDAMEGMFAIALAERALRCGVGVELRGGQRVCAWAVETAPAEVLERPATDLVLSGWRLLTLGFPVEAERSYRVLLAGRRRAEILAAFADPLQEIRAPLPFVVQDVRLASAEEEAAVELCKLARLLPAAAVAPEGEGAVVLAADALARYRMWSAQSLRPVVEAEVPLARAERARFVAFRPADGGIEQYAVVIGTPEHDTAPLCRLHSECFTGDIFGSLRCDCGPQLEAALARMREEGCGVLLYLRQEGRGIGLVNKLRAYRLQGGGLDTVDANIHLGFEPDERDFLAAATMLRQLRIPRVRLLTNNPDKVESLARHGIAVAARVAHRAGRGPHNAFYLETKAHRSGHLLDLARLRAILGDRRSPF